MLRWPALVYAALCVTAALLVNRTVPAPYMDEIFHVPQARRYCSHRFDMYDEKITTPPGLYLVAVALHHVLPRYTCSEVGALRSANLMLLLALPWVVAWVLEDLQGRGAAARARQPPEADAADPASAAGGEQGRDAALGAAMRATRRPSSRSSREGQVRSQRESGSAPGSVRPPPAGVGRDPLRAIYDSPRVRLRLEQRRASAHWSAPAHTIALLPPLWFFGLLYYTDVGSVFFVLATAVALRRRRRLLAALAATMALLFRQTNVVWLGLAVALPVLEELRDVEGWYDPQLGTVDWREAVACVVAAAGVVRSRRTRGKVARIVAAYAAPLAPGLMGFAYVLHRNGGIALGDKSHHSVALHLVQPLYLVLFATALAWPALLAAQPTHKPWHAPAIACKRLAVRLAGSPSKAAASVVALGVIYLTVQRGSVLHPFVVADNRHFTFYLYRYLRASWVARFAAVPAYLACGAVWVDALGPRSFLVVLTLFGCCVATLVPAPLVEPRYFLLPFLFLRFLLPAPSGARMWLLLESLWYVAINLATLALFLGRSFEWPSHAVDASRNESTTMRFMW
ncbi:hypothetical protein ACQY0O_004617 [Thecaphora frezii]